MEKLMPSRERELQIIANDGSKRLAHEDFVHARKGLALGVAPQDGIAQRDSEGLIAGELLGVEDGLAQAEQHLPFNARLSEP